MNINTVTCSLNNLKKQHFKLKHPGKDGLVLKVHHTITKNNKLKLIRFHYGCFNATGNVFTAVNHNGEIVVVELLLGKYWILKTEANCTVIKFSHRNQYELLIGCSNGIITINNSSSGVNEILRGHEYAIEDFSFSNNDLCVSYSLSEAIVWNLNTKRKVKVLKLEKGSALKLIMFMPITNHILACFHDDVIQIWRNSDFQIFKQILPSLVKKVFIRSITFTTDGRAMVIAGHSNNIILFIIDIWAVVQTISLPESVSSIRKIEFLSNSFDAGANKILVILSSNGQLLFFNMESETIVGMLPIQLEVIKFALCPQGRHVLCVMNSEILIYNLSQYVGTVKLKKHISLPTCKKRDNSNIKNVQLELKRILDSEKLKGILKEFCAYPDLYRTTIWSNILNLPNSRKQYDSVIKIVYESNFDEFEKNYPMENKQDLKNTKRILNALVSWCPFFTNVEYLPIFVYPFVKLFQNEPILCFEAVITIIVNFCQYWFEYHPLPPLNILGIVENILLEHEPDLLLHLTTHKITSKIYAWPILQSTFSEVLSSNDWYHLWDHIISNEPSFLLFAIVAYNIIQKQSLMQFVKVEQFTEFYQTQNMLVYKKFISKIYNLMDNTSENNHPRKYLSNFKPCGDIYPSFVSFPIEMEEYNDDLRQLNKESLQMLISEKELLDERSKQIDKLKDLQRNSEEMVRLTELRKFYQDKLNKERTDVLQQKERLQMLRTKLQDKEIEVLLAAKSEMIEKSSRDHLHSAETLKTVQEINESTSGESVEKELINHYVNLLKHKVQIKQLMCDDNETNCQRLKSDCVKLIEEIEKAKKVSTSREQLKQLNIATGLTVMNDLIKKVECEILAKKKMGYSVSKANILAAETQDLALEINKLTNLLTTIKSNEQT